MIVPLIWCEREKGSDSILTLPDYRGGGLHRFGRVIRVLKAAPTLMEFEIACQSNCEDFLRVVALPSIVQFDLDTVSTVRGSGWVPRSEP